MQSRRQEILEHLLVSLVSQSVCQSCMQCSLYFESIIKGSNLNIENSGNGGGGQKGSKKKKKKKIPGTSTGIQEIFVGWRVSQHAYMLIKFISLSFI